jgi:hypothetical protein
MRPVLHKTESPGQFPLKDDIICQSFPWMMPDLLSSPLTMALYFSVHRNLMSNESPVESRFGNDKLQIGPPNLMNLWTDANYLHLSLAPDSFRVFLQP